MTVAIRCRCGKVKGEADMGRAYTRATCYCRDCQAYARFLGQPGLMDANGGTDIVPMSPAGVRITDGLEHVACMALSDKGVLRWYASCCRTALGNTARDPKLPYAGMVTTCFDTNPEVIDAALGPRGRIALHTGSATGPVRSTPVAFFIGGLRILGNVLAARIRGQRPTLFFEPDGRPIRTPQVLTVEQRRELGANAG